MADPAIIAANERRKSVASVFFNLGAALIGATVTSFWDKPRIDVPLGYGR